MFVQYMKRHLNIKHHRYLRIISVNFRVNNGDNDGDGRCRFLLSIIIITVDVFLFDRLFFIQYISLVHVGFKRGTYIKNVLRVLE